MGGRSGLRPAGLPRQALVLAALGAAIFTIARTTGSGWLMVILSGVVAGLAVATVWPALVLRGVAVSAAAGRDATAGRPFALSLAVSGRGLVQVRVLQPEGRWLAVEAPGRGEAPVVPDRRGVVESVDVEVRCAAPLGLVPWRRRLAVPLPRAVEVGPEPIAMTWRGDALAGGAGAKEIVRGRSGVQTVRSTREYVPGDPIRLVHWSATARWGRLMVKELEEPESPRLVIIVDLRGDEPGTEAAAGRAAGLAIAALRAGVPVDLLTAERSGPAVGPVQSPLEAGRRLARAIAAAPPEGPLPAGTSVVRIAARSAAR